MPSVPGVPSIHSIHGLHSVRGSSGVPGQQDTAPSAASGSRAQQPHSPLWMTSSPDSRPCGPWLENTGIWRHRAHSWRPAPPCPPDPCRQLGSVLHQCQRTQPDSSGTSLSVTHVSGGGLSCHSDSSRRKRPHCVCQHGVQPRNMRRAGTAKEGNGTTEPRS